VNAIDQPRAMALAELAFELCEKVLCPGGDFLVKVFQGAGLDDYRARLSTAFTKVATRKPPASRERSRELYLLARNFRL
jgi:23S rRNA (uridine2552-2'-O)-methyltransferase